MVIHLSDAYMISNNLSISTIRAIVFKYQLRTAAKKQILNFVKKDVYDEKVTLKCLKCDYEETVPWDIVDETWDREDSPYPISYCQRCDKPHFVPIDIYNQKKKK